MKKDIHRIELRNEAPNKSQEQMIKDMKIVVYKRETIQLKSMFNV